MPYPHPLRSSAKDAGVFRKTSVLVGAAVVSLLAAGCGESNTGGDAPAAEDAVLGQVPPLESLDPNPILVGREHWWAAIYDSLIELDENAEPIPGLAESWELSEDQLTLTFQLRAGLTFHDGSSMTADEIVWNIEHALTDEVVIQGDGFLAGASATALDDHTVELQLAQKTPQVFAILLNLRIVKPDTRFDESAVGSGAFKVESFEPPNQLVLTRFEDYWDADRPSVETLTIKTYPDTSAAALALQAGEIDVLRSPSLSDVGRLEEQGAQIVAPATSGNLELLVNVTSGGPLGNPAVRRALSLAMDRERFATQILEGLVRPTDSIWPEGSPLYDKDSESAPFDLNQAQQILNDEGVSDLKFEVVVDPAANPDWADFLPIYQADLASIGVELEIRQMERTAYLDTFLSATFPDMIAHNYGFGSTDPAMMFAAFPFHVDGNPSRFESAEYGDLIAAGMEADPSERESIYAAIDELATATEQFIIPATGRPLIYALSSGVDGFNTLADPALPDYRDLSVQR